MGAPGTFVAKPTLKTCGYGNPNVAPLVGDWNGDGLETQGVWRQGQWFLANTLAKATADLTFSYSNATDIPVVGDWDGDGKETPGYYRNGAFSLRNSNSAGAPDLTFGFGDPVDIPLAGDWNGDGVDTVGVFDPVHAVFMLTNNPTPKGIAEIVVRLGDAGMRPLVGDWNDDGLCGFDGISANVIAEMITQNARVTGLASVLQTQINPPTLGSMGKSAVDRSIDVGGRQLAGKSYFFVLNYSANTLTNVPMVVTGLPAGQTALNVLSENRQVTLQSAHSLNDSFQPYQLHIYTTN